MAWELHPTTIDQVLWIAQVQENEKIIPILTMLSDLRFEFCNTFFIDTETVQGARYISFALRLPLVDFQLDLFEENLTVYTNDNSPPEKISYADDIGAAARIIIYSIRRGKAMRLKRILRKKPDA